MSSDSERRSDSPEFKFWRIAFKVTTGDYNFKAFDTIQLDSDEYPLFEPEVFKCNTFYDLCRKGGHYYNYHDDFVQTYFLDLFTNTEFSCKVFVFVEEVTVKHGHFVQEPHPITIAPAKKGQPIPVRPDFDMFYIESRYLSIDPGSFNDIFLSTSSNFIRGSRFQRGSNFVRNHEFSSFMDAAGMSFIKLVGSRGLVPNLNSSPTLVPLILITGLALGYKSNIWHISRILSQRLADKLAEPRKMRRHAKRTVADFSLLYSQIQSFLHSSFLMPSLNYKNCMTRDLFTEILARLEIPRDYARLREELETLHRVTRQLSNQEILKSQRSLKTAIFLLGLFILCLAVVVCTVLGVEPLISLLHGLGLLPENVLPLGGSQI